MAYDPVLDRDLFRPKSRGIEDVAPSEENEDLKSRREQALAMIEASKEKFDPKNFQTLTEQDRPQVFRPVAVNMPAQQQTVTTAQRMQQMAAQGMQQPVRMARGGPVYHFAEGGMKPTINSYGYTENLTSDEADTLAKEKASEATVGLRSLGAGVKPTNLLTTEEQSDVNDRFMDQYGLTASERNDRAVRAKDKYYTDRALQILEENTGDRFKPLEDRPEASTEFGRLGAVDVKVENARIAEAKARAVAEIKDRLIKEDIGGDSFTNAYNLFSKESSAERAARQERQARERANLEKYGTANPAPEFKDSLGGSFYNISEELRTNTPEGFGGKTIAEEYIKFSPNLPAGRQARAEGVLAAGRDAYGAEAPLISDLEKTKYDQGVASLANAEKGIAAGREAYGAEAPLAVDQEAKGLAALRDSVRMGDQPGAAADASRVAAGIGSAENKPTASVAGTPVTSGASTAGGAATAGGGTDANAGLGSFKEQGKAIDTGSMTLEGIRADRKREREDNLNLALIQAGLSIMGGKSSNALQNIGEGARAGVAQFASQESESKRLEREARRDLMEQQRSERDFREKQRQFGITSGLEDKRLTEAAESNRLTRELQAELGRGRLQLDTLTAKQNWESSQAKIELERTIANNTKAYQDGKLSLDQLTLKNQEAKDLADQNYKSELLKIEKQKLTQPSETVKTAATIGGWDPKSDKNPTAEQIIAGLDRMSEKDELSTLEKIIRDPLVQDEDLKKNATARFNAIMSRRGGISEGATATNSKGERIIYKGGQWVPYNP